MAVQKFGIAWLDEAIDGLEGRYVDVPEPMAEGEEIVGEMSEAAKACHSVIVSLNAQKTKAWADLVRKWADKIEEGTQPADPNRFFETHGPSLFRLCNRMEFATKLMWHLIHETLNVPFNLGLRQGFKLVKLPESGDREKSSLKGYLFGFLGD